MAGHMPCGLIIAGSAWYLKESKGVLCFGGPWPKLQNNCFFPFQKDLVILFNRKMRSKSSGGAINFAVFFFQANCRKTPSLQDGPCLSDSSCGSFSVRFVLGITSTYCQAGGDLEISGPNVSLLQIHWVENRVTARNGLSFWLLLPYIYFCLKVQNSKLAVTELLNLKCLLQLWGLFSAPAFLSLGNSAFLITLCDKTKITGRDSGPLRALTHPEIITASGLLALILLLNFLILACMGNNNKTDIIIEVRQ